jgi:hypothetical protein
VIVGREEVQRQEAAALACYAVRSADSRGRRYPEPEDPYRTAFQRDRDRIIHSSAYRRLGNKTQVVISFEGDHYRTWSWYSATRPARLSSLDRMDRARARGAHLTRHARTGAARSLLERLSVHTVYIAASPMRIRWMALAAGLGRTQLCVRL